MKFLQNLLNKIPKNIVWKKAIALISTTKPAGLEIFLSSALSLCLFFLQ